MVRQLSELETISKAIHSSFELLQSEGDPSKLALESLKNAEQTLIQAIDYVLTDIHRTYKA